MLCLMTLCSALDIFILLWTDTIAGLTAPDVRENTVYNQYYSSCPSVCQVSKVGHATIFQVIHKSYLLIIIAVKYATER